MYENVDNNKLYFEYEGPTKDVSFYEYTDSKELFDKLKNGQLKYDDGLKKQKEFLKKLNEIKNGKKLPNKKKWLIILKNLKIPERKFLIF